METTIYNSIKKKVSLGFTIRQALKRLKIPSSNFYKLATELQKRELKMMNSKNALILY